MGKHVLPCKNRLNKQRLSFFEIHICYPEPVCIHFYAIKWYNKRNGIKFYGNNPFIEEEVRHEAYRVDCSRREDLLLLS